MGFRFNSDSITPASSGGSSGDAVWGDITGTLSDQTDLADALSAKQNTLVSGTNIKTINDQSLLGSGNITISGSVPNQNTAVGATNPLEFWEGTSAEYESGGGSTTYYNWESSGSFSFNGASLPSSIWWKSVAYGSGKFIAVGGDSVGAYSTDGSSWTSMSLPTLSDGTWCSICYGDNKFIIVPEEGSDVVAYSTNGGSDWNTSTLPSSGSWKSVTYGNNIFVAVSGMFGRFSSAVAAYSADGITWTASTLPAEDDWRCVTFGDNKFVAISPTSVAYSTDGETWTSATIDSHDWNSIVYGNGKFIAVGSGYYAISTDGITWTSYTTPITGKCIGFGNGKFIRVPSNGITAYYSTDGMNWTSMSLPNNTYWDSIAFGNNVFVSIASHDTSSGWTSNYAAYSTGGSILSVYTTDENPTTSSVVYDNTTTQSALTITAVGTGTITCSDSNTYTYNAGGNQTTTQTVGEAHPDWICMIEGVGIKKGSTFIAKVGS